MHWLRDAAQGALGSGAPDAAARYLERALQEPPVVELRALLHPELGRAQMGLDHDRAAESFGDAAESDDVSSRVEAQRWQAIALGYAGRLREAMSTYDRAIELVGADRESALRLTGAREFYGAWYGDAPDRTERRVRLGELASGLDGKTQGERQVLAAAAVAAMHDGAMPASQALRLAQTIDRSGLSWPDRFDDVTRGYVGFVQIICNDDAAADLFENHAISECASQGRLIDLGFALAWLSIIQFRGGSLLDAEVSARRGWESIGVVEAAGNWLENRGFTNPAYIPWQARVAPSLAALESTVPLGA